jgi:hypothetical protein
MRRTAPSAAGVSSVLGAILKNLTDGIAQIDIDATRFATVDARSRTLDVQIDPLLDRKASTSTIRVARGPIGLWNTRGVPGELARQGWRLNVYDGPRELLALGRGTSALTGHIHLNPEGLWKLRKLL